MVLVPVPKLVAGVINPPAPLPKSIETLLEPALATAKSNLVSPLKSPTATELGADPTAKLVAGVINPPAPLPKSIEMLLEPKLATARSNLVSPLKSPTATEFGFISYCKVSCWCNKPACHHYLRV